ncbi:Uncharacterised protein [Mycolicibacterium vanbaalenii]|uniref:Thiamine biosynthesis protein ThiS n=1 Tax=Mycolicibacterium vanbaalenii TaxID=110539 RepID=A0A5S9PWG7_MYCVN|nr:sulfur carrier protein ThiS [Mycolicibacterium vanbaalenii]CAA0108748.1 Uncharacterised protein [Mycolicibacterium vanbaalenii]
MKVVVNDETVEIDDQMTVAGLLESLGFPEKGIAVAVRGERSDGKYDDWSVIPRSQWNIALNDGAKVEVVTAVQGG